MKKVLLRGPILTASGYGEHARMIYRALKSEPNSFDIYIHPISWGQTSWLWQDNQERKDIDELINKTQIYVQQGGQFDVALLVTIPNEWERIAPITIGITAGIESSKVSSQWLIKSNQVVDKVIVPSMFSAEVFKNTIYGAKDQNGQDVKLKLEKPIEVIGYPIKKFDGLSSLDLNLDYDFNFLCVAQAGPRKNLEKTVEYFYKTFKDKKVGLILKISKANNSTRDRIFCQELLSVFKQEYPNALCKTYLLHGFMTEEEMHSLYLEPKIKCLLSLTHGEGYGLPLYEAAYSGLPIITHEWGGQADFLFIEENGKKKSLFTRVEYELAPIQQNAVWDGVLEKDSMWAYPKEVSCCTKMMEVYKDYGRFKGQAKKLKEHLLNNEYDVNKKVCDSILGRISLAPKEIDGISFCIPTNGKRIDKTKILLKSIRLQKGKPCEIILCGDIDSFKEEKDLILVDQKDAAHNRKVALLRNKAAEKAKYNVIAWCDDDIILEPDWLEKTIEFSKTNGWNILGNKVYSPDGTRYWDRSFLNPHVLAEYSEPAGNTNLYQSSAFFLIRKEVWKNVKWDETKLVYADREGGIPEDIQYSFDLIKKQYPLHFNESALVWHNDDSYTEFSFGPSSLTLKKEVLQKQYNMNFFLPEDEQFESILGKLNV